MFRALTQLKYKANPLMKMAAFQKQNSLLGM